MDWMGRYKGRYTVTSGPLDTPCFVWTGYRIGPPGNKRPAVKFNGKLRLATTLFCDDCPPGLERSHLCGNDQCVRIDHIVYETRSQNQMRKPKEVRIAAGVKSHVTARERNK